jgi:hypothetical protein
VNQE